VKLPTAGWLPQKSHCCSFHTGLGVGMGVGAGATGAEGVAPPATSGFKAFAGHMSCSQV
jgi:hypothetical protein